MRESPAFDVISGLAKLGATVAYMDPHVPELAEGGHTLRSVSPSQSFANYDAVVVITNHRTLDWERMVKEAKLIVDTRDALRDRKATGGARAKIVLL